MAGDGAVKFSYTTLGEDEAREFKQREASILAKVAQSHLAKDEPEYAWNASLEALELCLALGDSEGQANAIRVMISVHRALGNTKDACDLAEEEAANFRRRGDRRGEGVMLLASAEINAERSAKRRDEARDSGLRAKEIFKEIGDREMEGTTLLVLVDVFQRQEKKKEILQTSHEALALYRELKDRQGEGRALHGLAVAFQMAGQLDDALKMAEKARDMFMEVQDRKREAAENQTMAQFYMMKEDWARMRESAESAHSIFQEDDDYASESAALSLLVQAYVKGGESEKALEVTKDNLERYEKLNFVRGQAICFMQLAELLRDSGEKDEALENANKGLELCQKLGDKRWESEIQTTISDMSVASNDAKQAKKAVDKAVDLLREQGDQRQEAITVLRSLVNVYTSGHFYDEANIKAAEALEYFRKEGDKREIAIALFVNGCSQHLAGEDQQAVKTLKEARGIFKGIGETMLQIRCVHMLANIHIELGNSQEAVRQAQEAVTLCRKIKDQSHEVTMLIFKAQCHIAVVAKRVEEGVEKTMEEHGDELDLALAASRGALKIAQKLDDVYLQAASHYEVAEVELICAEFEASEKAINEALRLFTECDYAGPGIGEAAAHIKKADLLYTMSRHGEALGEANTGLQMAREKDDRKFMDLAETIIEKIQGASQQTGPALQAIEVVAEAVAEVTAASSIVVPEKPKGMDPVEVSATVHGLVDSLIGVEIEADTPFMDAGVDSLLSIELRSALVKQFAGLGLGSTLTFDYPTVKALSDHIVEKSLNQ